MTAYSSSMHTAAGRRMAALMLLFGIASAFQPLAVHRPSASVVAKVSASDQNELLQASSASFAMDPDDPEGDRILERLGLDSEDKKSKMKQLAELVVEWNANINLVSRKDCSVPVVYGRHVLPCLATLGVEDPPLIGPGMVVADVGTGGGFPGLPLAIAHPEAEFILIDSVGKKLGAVQNMADRLGLTNVRTHHGRAEEYAQTDQTADVVIGRSVAAIPKYCFWIQNLLKSNGMLLYMIGGDVDAEILEMVDFDVEIDLLLDGEGVSDKRLLGFSRESVLEIAANSGEVLRIPNKTNKKPTKRIKRKAKGMWDKRDPSTPKQRGYENFKRYDAIGGNGMAP